MMDSSDNLQNYQHALSECQVSVAEKIDENNQILQQKLKRIELLEK